MIDYMNLNYPIPPRIKNREQLNAFLNEMYEEAKALQQAEMAAQKAMADILNQESKEAAKKASKKSKSKKGGYTKKHRHSRRVYRRRTHKK